MASGHYVTSYRTDHKLVRTNFVRFWWVVLALVLLYLPFVFENRELFGISLSNTQLLGMSLVQINFALIAVIGAVGLNLLIGYTGQISLGNAAFFAIGAIGAGVTGVQWGWPFPFVLLSAGLLGAVVGVIVGLPSLRLRGLYLLMATLGLHFIANFAFLEYQNRYFGPVGIRFQDPNVFGWVLDDHLSWYFLLLFLVALSVLTTKNLLRSREGRAFVSVRDQDIAAGAAGINVAATKLRAFAFSSFMVSVAGACYVWYLSNAQQEIFTLLLAIQFIAMIIIGGLGSIPGAIFGALLWQLLPSVIDTLSGSFGKAPLVGDMLSKNGPQLNNIILGLVIMVVLVVKPEGLNGMWKSIQRSFRQWPYTT